MVVNEAAAAAAAAAGSRNGASGSTTSTEVDAATLASYHRARSTLITTERSLRHDALKSSSLTPLESQADTILTTLRTAQWKQQEEDLSAYPGMPLRASLAKGARQTDLWRILQRMPKGGALHCHMDGTVPATWLIDEAVSKYGGVIHVRADRPLSEVGRLWDSGVEFRPMNEEDVEKGNVYEEGYDGSKEWMTLQEARDSFPFEDVYAGPPTGYARGVDLPGSSSSSSYAATTTARTPSQIAFDSYLHSLMTLTPAHGSPATSTSRQAWSRFLSTFGIIGGFISYTPLLYSYIKQMVKVHARDGCQYLEARLNFFEENYVGEDAKSKVGHQEWCQIFVDAVREARQELEQQEGITHFLDARIIYCTVRIVDNERLRWYLEDCLELKKRFGKLIVGFDLVGHEDPGVTLMEYAPELLWFQQQCSSQRLHIPYLFHAGETFLSSSSADSNLYDALLLSTLRIGHGYSLTRHPHLMKLCKERGVCVEVCPISNEALGYCKGGTGDHPLHVLLANGVECVLSNDDATQFGNFGLSHDLYQYFTSTASAGLASLYTLIHASLRHASLDDPADVEAGERQKYLDAFEVQWEAWVRWVVDEYGEGEERVKKVAKVDGEMKNGDEEAESRFFWQY